MKTYHRKAADFFRDLEDYWVPISAGSNNGAHCNVDSNGDDEEVCPASEQEA